jgi:hypothetical protein
MYREPEISSPGAIQNDSRGNLTVPRWDPNQTAFSPNWITYTKIFTSRDLKPNGLLKSNNLLVIKEFLRTILNNIK